MAEEEYIIKEAELSKWQKWLNQWRHDFIIEVISSDAVFYPTTTHICMAIKRTKKEKQ
jgi:hypothetical protein